MCVQNPHLHPTKITAIDIQVKSKSYSEEHWKSNKLDSFFLDPTHPSHSPVCKSGRITVSISVPTNISVIAIISRAQL